MEKVYERRTSNMSAARPISVKILSVDVVSGTAKGMSDTVKIVIAEKISASAVEQLREPGWTVLTCGPA